VCDHCGDVSTFPAQKIEAATPAENGAVVDLSTPSPVQLAAWSALANEEARLAEAQAVDLKRHAAKLLAQAVTLRDHAQMLRDCVQDKSILPTSQMCRVCVAKPPVSGWGCLMTNCDTCNTRPIHSQYDPPFQHRK